MPPESTKKWNVVWSSGGHFGSTTSRQNTNLGSSNLPWYAAEAYLKATIRYKYQDRKHSFWLAYCEFGYGNEWCQDSKY